MNAIRTLLAASILIITGLSFAQADADPITAGTWKLAVGQANCSITLATDGTASPASDCSSSGGVARWQAKYNGVELKTASGETVGILKAKGDSYTGERVSDGRSLVLSH